MVQDSIHDRIITLRDHGIGRKKIAKSLGISEWKVRCVDRARITDLIKGKEKNRKVGRLRTKRVVKTQRKPKKAVVLSDIHIPYHDQAALSLAIEFMKDYEPDTIILAGDIIDHYSVSSYRKDPCRLDTFQDELNETIDFLSLVRNNHPDAEIYYLEGNHENRLSRFLLDKAPALTSLTCLSIDELLRLDDFNIKYVSNNSSVMLGDLEVIHGTVIRKSSAYSAKAHHEKTGGSVLCGHTHRLGVFCRTNRWGTHVAVENGFLGRNDFEYVNMPDWQSGFSTVEFFDDGRFFVRLHIIRDNNLIVDGTVYEAR